MSVVQAVNIWHRYGTRVVLENVNLDIQRGEIFSLIGPTGAGKTTLLRILNLLERPAEGYVLYGGHRYPASARESTTARRKMAMVFQRPIVFSTTVQENIAYPLRVRSYDRKTIRKRTQQAIEKVELGGYERRDARSLSGGETQRVALARALITSPNLLLLDEPTANLDPLSVEVIEKLVVEESTFRGTTVIMSTHDRAQGQRLAHRIGVIFEGRLAQVGTVQEIFTSPKSVSMARFVGMDNIISGVVVASRQGIIEVQVGECIIEAISNLPVGTRVRLGIRPEDVTLSPSHGRTSARNFLCGPVVKMDYRGPLTRVEIGEPCRLVAVITSRSAQELGVRPAKRIWASFKASAIHILKVDQAGPSA